MSEKKKQFNTATADLFEDVTKLRELDRVVDGIKDRFGNIYDQYLPRTLTGIVTRSQHSEFRLDAVDPFTAAEDWEWVSYKDVLKAELSKEWTDEEMIDP